MPASIDGSRDVALMWERKQKRVRITNVTTNSDGSFEGTVEEVEAKALPARYAAKPYAVESRHSIVRTVVLIVLVAIAIIAAAISRSCLFKCWDRGEIATFPKHCWKEMGAWTPFPPYRRMQEYCETTCLCVPNT